MWTQWFGDRLVKAVKDGFVPEERINDAALRIVRTILAFDKDHKEYDMSVVGCKEHIALAKKVAEKGITLLKNAGVLPLKKGAVKKLPSVPSGPTKDFRASSSGDDAPRHWKRIAQPSGTSATQETLPPEWISERNSAAAA